MKDMIRNIDWLEVFNADWFPFVLAGVGLAWLIFIPFFQSMGVVLFVGGALLYQFRKPKENPKERAVVESRRERDDDFDLYGEWED